MKTGILTIFHGNDNWGGVLQGYALKTYIEKNFPSAQADIIKYRSDRNIIYKGKFQKALQYSPVEVIKKAGASARKKLHRKDIGLRLSKRHYLFESFRRKYTTNQKVYFDDDMKELSEEYDCLICGSDQIWNPNVGRGGFLLSGAGDDCLKISYAASIARNDLSENERAVMIPLIEQFNYVSVREKTAKQLIEKYSKGKIKADEVLDPSMLLTKDEWKKVSVSNDSSNPYALVFFFSESWSCRKEIERICSEKGMAVKFIPYANDYIKSDELGNSEKLFNVGPEEFIALFMGAEYIFTDSFHGAAFSINFNKQFQVFERDKNNKASKNSRIYDLLKKFGLSGRLVQKPEKIAELIEKPVDYGSVNKKLDEYRKQSHEFLEKAFSGAKEKNKAASVTVGDIKKDICCGCGKCVNICPAGCIEMKEDREGFLYPDVNADKCIKCGKCLSECTAGENSETISELKKAYTGFSEDEDIRRKSSSGGLFYTAAEYVITQLHGTVYGAAYDSDLRVIHSRAENIDTLKALMRSKYVQSEMTDIYEPVLNDLKHEKTVLFTGTPCQVWALKSFLKGKCSTEKLYLMDFICHGVPSPGVWSSYLSYLSENSSEIKNINFRDKTKGWHDFHFTAEFTDGRRYSESHEKDPFMISFLSDKNIRPSCYSCKFKGNNYASDITLGDAWKIEKEKKDWSDDKGVSLFIIRSEKGNKLFEAVQGKFKFIKAENSRWESYNPSLVSPVEKPESRRKFFEDFASADKNKFWRDAKKQPVKKKLRYSAKRIMKLTGIEKHLRRR